MDNIISLDLSEEPSLCFSSLNTSCLKIDYPLQVRVLLYILFSTSSLLTVFGNLLVIITVVHFRQLRTSTNYLILSLAVSDLLVGGIVMPPSMIRSVESCWYLGNTFYRYYAVCHLLLYHSKITPSTVIFHAAQRQARAIQSTNAQMKTAEGKASVSKSEKKVTKTLAIIMGVFLTSWLPFFTCNCLDPFIGYSVPLILFDLFLWVGYFNSMCNPIIYAFFYSWFKQAFRVILSGGIFRASSSHTRLF
ncbi:trace amine-associated receptor 8-like [Neoarius graeffei]|uniref:trace amine-associated receptor 8-like n=1 Tax=Neoarius graeffei TaxID=443677 RepID=UPI00298BFD93|nr:trace amine-associated receptor 8-like [Neoarius graeffei]